MDKYNADNYPYWMPEVHMIGLLFSGKHATEINTNESMHF